MFYLWNPELHIQYFNRVVFLIEVITAYEADSRRETGPK